VQSDEGVGRRFEVVKQRIEEAMFIRFSSWCERIDSRRFTARSASSRFADPLLL
jgi:hypothetical protein